MLPKLGGSGATPFAVKPTAPADPTVALPNASIAMPPGEPSSSCSEAEAEYIWKSCVESCSVLERARTDEEVFVTTTATKAAIMKAPDAWSRVMNASASW